MWKWGECRVESDELMHWGILGQKWGIRRFQNKDGSLTEEGKKRYYSKEEKEHAFKQDLLDKAIENCKRDQQHWSSMVKRHEEALEDLKTDKRKGDWYDTAEEKQRLIREVKAELSSAKNNLSDWNKSVKELNEMLIDDMPVKTVKERTSRNYIINASVNEEDLNEGYKPLTDKLYSRIISNHKKECEQNAHDLESLPNELKRMKENRSEYVQSYRDAGWKNPESYYKQVLNAKTSMLNNARKSIKFNEDLTEYFNGHSKISSAGFKSKLEELAKKNNVDLNWVFKYYSEYFPGLL